MIANKTILAICLGVFSAAAFSCCTAPESWSYIGANAQLRHGGISKKFGESTVRKTHRQGHIYYGYKLSENWAIEVGKESSSHKHKNSILSEGKLINGLPLSKELSPAEFMTNFKIKSHHFDLVFYKKIFEKLPLSFIPSLGISHLTMEVLRDNLYCGEFSEKLPQRKMKKSFLALKPSAGLQYDFVNGFSLRTSVSFVNTNGVQLKAQGVPSTNLQNRPKVHLKDSFVFGLGFLVNI